MSAEIVLGGIIAIVISFIAIFLYLRKDIKQKKEVKDNITEEALDDLNEAERRLEESHGEKEPTTILWELAKERRYKTRGEQDRRTIRRAEADNLTLSAKSRAEESSDDRKLQGRQDIQAGTINSNNGDTSSNKQPSTDNPQTERKSIFRKFLGKRS